MPTDICQLPTFFFLSYFLHPYILSPLHTYILIPYTLFLTPYSLTPYALRLIPYSYFLFPISYFVFCISLNSVDRYCLLIFANCQLSFLFPISFMLLCEFYFFYLPQIYTDEYRNISCLLRALCKNFKFFAVRFINT